MFDNLPPSKLMWLDLEMTGLDSDVDIILEVAVIITDHKFNELARYESKVYHDFEKTKKLLNNNSWWLDYPENKKIFLDQAENGVQTLQVQMQLIELIDSVAKDQIVYLAGNSIHSDRKFIAKEWPILNSRLHYRMLDVSSFKILMNNRFSIEFKKESNHRAILDVQDSINELDFYLKYLTNLSKNNEHA